MHHLAASQPTTSAEREILVICARVGAGAARSTQGALIHKKAPDLPRVVM